MKGLSEKTLPVFNAIKDLDLFNDYRMIGGTALSLQIHHRLSEDLDFCKWQDDPAIKKEEVEWPMIEKELKKQGEVVTDVLDLYQVIFYLNNVKISFYSNSLSSSKNIHSGMTIGNITLATLESLGITKLEVMSRRNIYRDYYDLYAILKEGISLKRLIDGCRQYSKHRMKTKAILSIISDSSRFRNETEFNLLRPVYDIEPGEIGSFIREKINREFNR